MRECQKQLIKNTGQEQVKSNNFTGKPDIKYVHTCKTAKIGMIITPKTEESTELWPVIKSICKKHCRKYRQK